MMVIVVRLLFKFQSQKKMLKQEANHITSGLNGLMATLVELQITKMPQLWLLQQQLPSLKEV